LRTADQRERMGTERSDRRCDVPKYLWKASYTTKGAKGVASDGGSSRRDAVKHATESVGGTLEGFYFAFGTHDAYVIADLPDNETAVAVALAVNSTDGATVETVVLLTPEEVDAGAKKTVEFRPAGG
jgi:uncharacterized protein with GYD domain